MDRARVGKRDVAMLLVGALATVTASWLFIRRGSLSVAGIASPEMPVHGDFDTFWRSARALLNGTDIYQTAAENPNLNPPLVTLLVAPLGLLDFLPAYRLFVLITIALVVASMLAVAAELRLRTGSTATVTIAALLSSPMLATLRLGQIYGLLMAGLVAAWIAGRREHPLLEGVALGLVVAMKPTLAPVLLLPALRSRWPTLGAALATGVGATVVGAFAAGPASFFVWIRLSVSTPVVTYFANAALPGTVVRLTSLNAWSRPVTELPGGLQIGVALGLAVLGGSAWVVRKPMRDATPDPAFWAITAAALLVSPIAWYTYLLLLMPGLLVLLALGRWPMVVLALGLSLIGEEWPALWNSAFPLSLYCGILLTYWAVLLSAAGPSVRAVPSPRHRLAERGLVAGGHWRDDEDRASTSVTHAVR